jgi:hydroxypyruvate isomerase
VLAMQRRRFLQGLGTGGAALAASLPSRGMAQTPPTAPPKAKITSSVMLWTLQGTFEQKLEIAARAGLQSVELVGEHVTWSDAEIARMKKLARSFGLGMDTIIATPDWGKRQVSMLDPAQREGFLADVSQSLVFAEKLEIPYIIVMSGNVIPGKTRAEQYASMAEGAKRAAALAEKSNAVLIFEPLNSLINHKGFFLDTCGEAVKLLREVNHPKLGLLFDIYHEQVQTGSVLPMIEQALPYVKVFHVADHPGRSDPGTGKMNYPEIYAAIRKTTYSGYLTMEYRPAGEQVASLIKAVNQFRASDPAA